VATSPLARSDRVANSRNPIQPLILWSRMRSSEAPAPAEHGPPRWAGHAFNYRVGDSVLPVNVIARALDEIWRSRGLEVKV